MDWWTTWLGLDPAQLILIVCGGLAGGFVTGLTGFGTGLVALAFWLHAVPPVLATPLVVVCAVTGQLQSLPAIWHDINWRRILPFVGGGVLGIPAGTYLLTYVPATTFKLFVGGLLIIYCAFMLTVRIKDAVTWGGRIADSIVGLGGGVMGGLAGLSGVPPTIWAVLRGWGKHEKRSVFQIFNLTILAIAGVSQAIAGLMTINLGKMLLVALPGTIVGAWLGRLLYARLHGERGDVQFDRIVLGILLFSGLFLVSSAF